MCIRDSYNIKDLVRGFLDADHFGYEEIAYLLLFGELPTVVQLDGFHETLTERRTLPPNFVRDVICLLYTSRCV